MFKGILLDIDNTLYHYDSIHIIAQKALVEAASALFDKSDVEILQALKTAKQWVKQDLTVTASSHNRLLYVHKMCDILEVDSLKYSLDLYNAYWDCFLEKMTLSEGAEIFLERNKNTPICLLTDLTAHIQHRKVQKLSLHSWANCMVTSEEAGYEKPHPYMFQLGLQKLGLQSHDVCMIGDSYKKDILGATRLGIKSYWLNVDQQETPKDIDTNIVTEITDLADIEW